MIVESRVNTYVILHQIAKFSCIALHPKYLKGPASPWSFQQFVVNLLYFCQLGRWEMVSQFNFLWTSLVVQWIKICLPTQGTQVWSLVWEDLTCRRATKPVCPNYWACMLELLKPLCLEPVLCNKKPPQWESLCPQQRPSTTKKKNNNNLKLC